MVLPVAPPCEPQGATSGGVDVPRPLRHPAGLRETTHTAASSTHTRIHQSRQAGCRSVRAAREDGETACAARSRYRGGRRGNASPVPLARDQDGHPHDRVTLPNPDCEADEGRTPVGQAVGLSQRYMLTSPTWNCRAASALLPPLRTHSTTRWHKSVEHLIPQDHTRLPPITISN